jgi:hypothetical protein
MPRLIRHDVLKAPNARNIRLEKLRRKPSTISRQKRFELLSYEEKPRTRKFKCRLKNQVPVDLATSEREKII